LEWVHQVEVYVLIIPGVRVCHTDSQENPLL